VDVTFWLGESERLTAISTTVIAIFTIVLAIATYQQAGLTRDSIELANKEFFVTHRPKILVQSVLLADKRERPKKNSLIDFMIANAGEARAVVTAFMVFPYVQFSDAAFIPFATQPNPKHPKGLVVDPGELCSVKGEYRSFDSEYDLYLGHRGARLFILGRVHYKGTDSIGRITGFCREYSRDTGMWHAVKDSEYEYAY
jgi:hypothetical protein